MPQIISNEHTTYIIPCICVCALYEREKNNYRILFLKINKFLLSYFQCLRFLIKTSKNISNSSFAVYSVSIIIRSCTKRYNVTGEKILISNIKFTPLSVKQDEKSTSLWLFHIRIITTPTEDFYLLLLPGYVSNSFSNILESIRHGTYRRYQY